MLVLTGRSGLRTEGLGRRHIYKSAWCVEWWKCLVLRHIIV